MPLKGTGGLLCRVHAKIAEKKLYNWDQRSLVLLAANTLLVKGMPYAATIPIDDQPEHALKEPDVFEGLNNIFGDTPFDNILHNTRRWFGGPTQKKIHIKKGVLKRLHTSHTPNKKYST
jgi:hypothetical protein